MLSLYIEVNAIAIFVLCVLLCNLRPCTGMPADEWLFRALLQATIAILVCDTVAWAVNSQTFAAAHGLNTMANVLYFVLTGLISLLWLLYADYRLYEDMDRLRRRFLFYLLPFLALTLVSLLTPLTGWLFFIDEANVYHRGNAHWFQALVAWVYLAYPTVLAMIVRRQSSSPAKRRECLTILGFVICPLILSIVQTLHYGTPLLWIGVTMSLLVTFINIQNRQISLDALTGINNRGRLNKYLSARMSERDAEGTLFLVLLDLDEFKAINDTYGHSVGDAALMLTADLLKLVCGREPCNAFLARYGGDEFAIVCHHETEAAILDLIAQIRTESHRVFQTDPLPCHPSLSIGYADYRPAEMHDIDAFIAAADVQMYRSKAAGRKEPHEH